MIRFEEITPARETKPVALNQFSAGRVYFVSDVDGMGPIKIGYTIGRVVDRLLVLQTGSPSRLQEIFSFQAPPQTEIALHRLCKESRLHGEWFVRSPLVLKAIDDARLGIYPEHVMVVRKPREKRVIGPKRPLGRPSLGEPWKAAGVSRRTWFRQQAASRP